MPDPPGNPPAPPDDPLAGTGTSDASLNMRLSDSVAGGTVNPPAWSAQASQARLDHEKSMQKAFKALDIVPSSKSTRRLMVLLAVQNDAMPASNVIRVMMDGTGSPRGPVQTALRKHFGLAETPFMFARPEGAELDPEVEKLFSKCVKLNPIVTKATKRFPIARHMYELVFESDQACLKAAAAGPFSHLSQISSPRSERSATAQLTQRWELSRSFQSCLPSAILIS
ncbi:BQ5605_C032g11035 [Microbotryum silenes-dioicae]|uniref:BQ5605_C032g11035 protein n=1 Tax=Microbotryum silenes-dioicae TaxID=796604 RepID=A0A2X0MHB0_9BASI|nr:BQ5605_C032g11035 [Microbotryum silenes-dioicae]